MTTEQKMDVVRPVWIVSIPEIPRCGTLYEDIDVAYAHEQRIFHEDQADRFETCVELYERIKKPTRCETLTFQNDINAINKKSWPVYTLAPPGWKHAPIVKHDNSKVKLMPQRGPKQTSKDTHCALKKTRTSTNVRSIAKPNVKLPTVETNQPPKTTFTLADE